MKLPLVILLITFASSLWASKVEVEINGMTCGMCVESITKELKASDKVDHIVVSLDDKKASFEEIKGKKISDGEIRSAIKRAGYEGQKIRRY